MAVENGTEEFSESEFGVWTRVIGLSNVRATDVKTVFQTMDDACGGTGRVSHEFIIGFFHRAKENEVKSMKSHVEPGSKKWLEEQRQIREQNRVPLLGFRIWV